MVLLKYLQCIFLRHFGAALPVSSSYLSVSSVFHKSSALSIFSTISSSAQVNSAQAKIRLQLTALASTMKNVTTEILSNNFPCISTFHCERLNIIALAQRGVIPNTIDLLFQYLALPFQYHSVISFSQTFSAFLLGVCIAFCLIHYMFNVPRNWEKEFVSKPFCPREMGMVTNSRTITLQGPHSLVQFYQFNCHFIAKINF